MMLICHQQLKKVVPAIISCNEHIEIALYKSRDLKGDYW